VSVFKPKLKLLKKPKLNAYSMSDQE
jgi:hypothetical protein